MRRAIIAGLVAGLVVAVAGVTELSEPHILTPNMEAPARFYDEAMTASLCKDLQPLIIKALADHKLTNQEVHDLFVANRRISQTQEAAVKADKIQAALDMASGGRDNKPVPPLCRTYREAWRGTPQLLFSYNLTPYSH